MAHHCTYSDCILWDCKKKQFYRSVTAHGLDNKKQERSLEILKIYESGLTYGRNLTFSYLGGYCVSFPGEKERYKYHNDSYYVVEEEFEEIGWECNIYVRSSEINTHYILRHDPSLKYLLQKFKGDQNEILLKLIAMYRKYPEIEPLVEIGQYNLALDKRLHKLTKNKKMEVINFVKNNLNDNHLFDLNKIFTCLKNNIKYKFYENFIKCKDDKELFNYLTKQNQEYSFYQDYKNMAIAAGHNFLEDYWKFPKSLAKAHEKVMKECKAIEDLQDKITNEQFKIVSEKLKKQEKIIDGNHYYIVQDSDDFKKHAKALNQCLVTAGYMNKIIKQKSILIFINDSQNNAVGTVEIDYNKKILQAYGNEKNRGNCLLPKEIMDSVKNYILSLKITKYKFHYTLPKNCYFKGLYNEDKSFNGMEFKEGKVYQTQYDDTTIIKNGSKCLGTDKVYHFCATIDNVKRWVQNPAAYALIEALGPIVKKNTALGSNCIKIKKIFTLTDIAKFLLGNHQTPEEICLV